MTIDQIRRFHSAKPFMPFTLHLTDGREFRVKHPEFMMQLPGGRTIHVATGDESFEVIDVLLVTSIESGNGKKNGRRRRN